MGTMIRRITSFSLALILFVAFVNPPPVAMACGPDFETPIYTPFDRPDDRDLSFERGQLGILQRGYWHLYLFEAYRNLNGRPFSEKELKALQSWQTDDSNANQPAGSRTEPQDWIETWETLR